MCLTCTWFCPHLKRESIVAGGRKKKKKKKRKKKERNTRIEEDGSRWGSFTN